MALSPGMSVTVEIKTGGWRILEYLYSPLAEIASEAVAKRIRTLLAVTVEDLVAGLRETPELLGQESWRSIGFVQLASFSTLASIYGQFAQNGRSRLSTDCPTEKAGGQNH
ncbi:hypothetical protein AB9F43_22655 [Rhizobium leguminosarum]|uniref:hypothetical protein n=1 Tax=Rhizobium leguminosarum TaxID=384 RepID=UPI003F983C21